MKATEELHHLPMRYVRVRLSRQLLPVVPSHIGDMLLKTSDPQASQLLLTLSEVLGVFVLISIAGDGKILDTEVQTNGGSRGLPEFLQDTL